MILYPLRESQVPFVNCYIFALLRHHLTKSVVMLCERKGVSAFYTRSHLFLSQLYIFTKMYNNNAYNEMITNKNNNVYNTAGIILFVNS